MMKKLVILSLIAIFLLSGCEQLKELYGIQPSGEEEYIPIEEIKIEGEPEEPIELPPMPPEEEILEIEENAEEVEGESEIPSEIEEEMPEEIIEEEEMPEELVEEKPKEAAKVLIVKETELVSLEPKAADPDEDKLVFTYTTPINTEGKWQTAYGDAGEYTITITASDGELTATKDVLIIVNKKEEPPVIEEALPEEETLEAKENSKLEFSIKASDLNKDPLSYIWKLDGEETSKERTYTYNIGYDDAGQHTIKASVSDGVNDVSRIWAVKVDNVNRKPTLQKITDIKVKETETVVVEPKATDQDKEDKITFSIDNNKFKRVDDKFEWKTTYDDAGEYTITITATDGTDTVSQTAKITVENVNRPPVIEDIILV